jgi:hypothetical protein
VGLLAAGCTGPIYSPDRQYFQGAIAPRSQWGVSGDIQNPAHAADGLIETAAIAPAGYARPSLVINFGRTSLINMVVVDHGLDENAYCRRLSIQTSDDGVHWVPRMTVPGLRRVTNALLPTQVLAKYVRLQVDQPGAGNWAVAEVYFN